LINPVAEDDFHRIREERREAGSDEEATETEVGVVGVTIQEEEEGPILV